MKRVLCYEIFAGLSLKNHTFVVVIVLPIIFVSAYILAGHL